jgi:hypothetical protein
MVIPMESWKDRLLKTLVVVLLGGYIVAQGGLSWAYSGGEEGLSTTGPVLLGQEFREVSDFSADVKYGPGFAYGYGSDGSTHKSNFI